MHSDDLTSTYSPLLLLRPGVCGLAGLKTCTEQPPCFCCCCRRGSGLVYVAYLDRDVRVFRAPNGSVSVQVIGVSG